MHDGIFDESSIFYGVQDINELLTRYKEKFTTFSQLLFWGTGRDAKHIATYLQDVLSKETKISFIDNDESVLGKQIYGEYVCCGKEQLLTVPVDQSLIIIASSQYSEMIYENILNYFSSTLPRINNFPICRWFAVFFRWYENQIAQERNECISQWDFHQEWAEIRVKNDAAIMMPQRVHASWLREYISTIVEMFDKGYAAVFFTDPTGVYLGTIVRKGFNLVIMAVAHDLPLCPFFLQHMSMKDVAEQGMIPVFDPLRRDKLFETYPLLDEAGRIVMVAEDVRVINSRQKREKQPLIWDIIPLRYVKDFFMNKKRIIISSAYRDMVAFQKRVDAVMNVIPYCLSLGDVQEDEVLLHSGGWYFGERDNIDICTLYAELIMRTFLPVLLANHVEIYCIDIDGRVDINRIDQRRNFPIYSTVALAHHFSNGWNVFMPRDGMGEGIHIVAGRRLTVDCPSRYAHSIYVYGPCVAFGTRGRDEETLESCLQTYFNQEKLPFRVVNCGIGGWNSTSINHVMRLFSTQLRDGDVVVIFDSRRNYFRDSVLWRQRSFSMKEIFDLPSYRSLCCFEDEHFAHCGADGYHVLAEFLFHAMKPTLEKASSQKGKLLPYFGGGAGSHLEVAMDNGLRAYLSQIRDKRVAASRIGAIVMNCNPFTRGHLFLIQEARKRVEYIYVFIVETDQSTFSFKDRLAMATANCANFSNVRVLPSGQYIISDLTFSAYFHKEELQAETIDSTMDVQIFGEAIAPCLGITFRFVGEEPFDKITAQYNETMKELLPSYGVEVIELPRFSIGNDVVSAQRVRYWLAQKSWENARDYLTEETWAYMEEAQLI